MAAEVVVVRADQVAPVRLAAFASLGASPGGANDSDTDQATWHRGIERDGTLVAVATLTRESSPRNAFRPVWRVRGMATLPQHQGQGHGGVLLGAALVQIATQGGGLLWGNLRLGAVPFYERHGFAVDDDTFLTSIGVPHRYGECMIAADADQ